MARVSTYLNFPRYTEEAFAFYRSVFKTEYCCPVARFGSSGCRPGHPIAEADKNLVIHIALPILGGHILMGTDPPESMGFDCRPGNNVQFHQSIKPPSPYVPAHRATLSFFQRPL